MATHRPGCGLVVVSQNYCGGLVCYISPVCYISLWRTCMLCKPGVLHIVVENMYVI